MTADEELRRLMGSNYAGMSDLQKELYFAGRRAGLEAAVKALEEWKADVPSEKNKRWVELAIFCVKALIKERP